LVPSPDQRLREKVWKVKKDTQKCEVGPPLANPIKIHLKVTQKRLNKLQSKLLTFNKTTFIVMILI